MKKCLILMGVFNTLCLRAFDQAYYQERVGDLTLVNRPWGVSFIHYLSRGMSKGLLCAKPIKNTNFDWKYYVRHNNLLLAISNENQAIVHYKEQGKEQNLDYCTYYSFAVLVHLYHIDMLDDFIEQILQCISLNPKNKFFISINIPVAQNLENKFIAPVEEYSKEQLVAMMASYDYYNFGCVNTTNCEQLYNLREYIVQKLQTDASVIDVMFSENRGVDIGGFLLQMDQLIQKNVPHDFIIKIHTKTHTHWRRLLMSILHIRFGVLLSQYEAVYACKSHFDFNNPGICEKNVGVLLKNLNLPKKNFNFSAGTMFIVSNKFTDFFKENKLERFFSKLAPGPAKINGALEHAFERIFGYVIDYIQLKTRIIGLYCSPAVKEIFD